MARILRIKGIYAVLVTIDNSLTHQAELLQESVMLESYWS